MSDTTYSLESPGRKDLISISVKKRIPLTIYVVLNTTFGDGPPYKYSVNIVKQHDNDHIKPMTHELVLTINRPVNREPLQVGIDLLSKFIDLEEDSSKVDEVDTKFLIKKEEEE